MVTAHINGCYSALLVAFAVWLAAWPAPAYAATIPAVDLLGQEGVVAITQMGLGKHFWQSQAFHVGFAPGLSVGMLASQAGTAATGSMADNWEIRFSHRLISQGGIAVGYSMALGAGSRGTFDGGFTQTTYVQPCALLSYALPPLEGRRTNLRALLGARVPRGWPGNHEDPDAPAPDALEWIAVPELAVEIQPGLELVIGGGGLLGVRLVR